MEIPNNSVLAGIDGSGLMPAVCDYAAWVAQRVGAPLTLLHTMDHHQETAAQLDMSGIIGIDSRDQLLQDMINLEQQRNKLKLQQGKLILQAAQQRAKQAGVAEPVPYQRHGSLVESLIDLEQQLRAVVIGVRGKVHENRPDKVGAKLEAIIRALHTPILVVNGEFSPPERVMLAYDGGKAAEKAVDMVAASPLYRGLSCHLVCVGQDGERLEQAEKKLGQASLAELSVSRLDGKPEQVLCDYQDQHRIDLTVMGAFSHTRLHDLLLGSFTTKMLNHSHKPLLLLR